MNTMQSNPGLGVFLHAIGGLAAASFYIPYKRVRNWSWESYWITGGFFSWIIAPMAGAALICPDLLSVLRNAPASSLFWTYLFGVMWGIGGLTFGLSMRYLGLSLGYSIALGFCAAFGTIIPPLFLGEMLRLDVNASGEVTLLGMVVKTSGQVTLLGVAVCLGGIAVCGWAGMRKEGELDAKAKTASIKEFSFVKGFWVAVFAGVMSACMAFAFASGKPISDGALQSGAPEIFTNLPVLVIALLGGFTTNIVWCLYLNARNMSFGNYLDAGDASLSLNYLFAALAGLTWYLQFFFYGMATTQMGQYNFSSWTLHMAFIIIFSNLWGLWFKEWKGASTRSLAIIASGILILILSTIVVGLGNYLAG